MEEKTEEVLCVEILPGNYNPILYNHYLDYQKHYNENLRAPIKSVFTRINSYAEFYEKIMDANKYIY